MTPASPLRRRLLFAGTAAGSLLLPGGFATAWAQSEGAVKLLEVQRAGAKAMSAEEFLRGAKLVAGTNLF